MTQRDGKHDLLGGFQVRATRHILTALQSQTTTATVVGAGTGSGKTNAFYLPAFSYLAGITDSSAWTRALAVYPRTELLKDQLDTAFAHACRLDDLWKRLHWTIDDDRRALRQHAHQCEERKASLSGLGKATPRHGFPADALSR